MIRAAGLVMAILVAVLVPPVARAAAPECVQPSTVYRDAKPWPQRLLAPERVWPLTTGAGVTVAVIGTGVDRANLQFGRDQVGAGTDLTGTGPAAADCDGRGTFAAGLIAARPHSETTFAGIAPGVRILPIRYAQATDRGDRSDDPDGLAKAIRAAISARVGVVCVVVPTTVDSPALDRAVAEARAADIVVVSSAVAQPGAVSYPTADASVIGVGAVASDGSAAGAESGDHIDVAAPGQNLISLGAGAGGRLGHIGPIPDATAYSAAFVAATAALIRAYRPELTAAAVAARIAGTAGGSADPRLGHGIVNLYAAVTAEGVESARTPASRDPIVVAPAQPPAEPQADRAALGIAAGALLLAGIVAVGAVTLRRGRTRFTPPGPAPPRR